MTGKPTDEKYIIIVWETPTAFYACRGLINPPDESGGYCWARPTAFGRFADKGLLVSCKSGGGCWVRPTAFGRIADMVCRLAVNPGVFLGKACGLLA